MTMTANMTTWIWAPSRTPNQFIAKMIRVRTMPAASTGRVTGVSLRVYSGICSIAGVIRPSRVPKAVT